MVEEKTGAEILALAHNGNLSNGRMFPIIESFNGKRIDREYADNRGACRKSNPDILVMQPAQDWATKNVPGALDGARDRRILLQG